VLGVNTLNQHLTYIACARRNVTIRNPSLSRAVVGRLSRFGGIFARLSLALSQGNRSTGARARTTTTAWMYQGDKEKLGQIGETFFNLLMALEAAQVEYDIGCEDIMTAWRTGDKR